jgi:hypothetical protein
MLDVVERDVATGVSKDIEEAAADQNARTIDVLGIKLRLLYDLTALPDTSANRARHSSIFKLLNR